MRFTAKDHRLNLDDAAIMGILNVTPDSFSDGGLWLDPAAALKHAAEMGQQGAAIIDVGGESTRPGAAEVPADEELRRILPVIEGLAGGGAVISVDTRKAAVAKVALEAGAHVINDTAGEASDRQMDRVAAETGAGIVIMHSRGTPATMKTLTDYDDVVVDVRGFLARRAEDLLALGIEEDAIVLDPGIGFAKTAAQNLELLARLETFQDLGFPLLVGTSRKSFIGAILDLPEHQRLEATAASCVIARMKGVRILRVHDVEPIVRAVRMAEAILGASE
ncbi:MAG: dihydropteroate synthase [Actinomycetota bacterium]